jgi:hypothetical protein
VAVCEHRGVFAKVVACDLDGTLLRSDGSLSERTRRALAACEAAGALVMICTARPVRWVRPIAAQITGHPVAACANGAVLWDLARDQLVSAQPLDPVVAGALIKTVDAVLPGGAWAVEQTLRFGHEPAYKPFWPLPDDALVGPVATLLQVPPVKLMFRHQELMADEMLARAHGAIATNSALDRAVELTHSNATDGLLEVSAAGVNKGTALARVCAVRGIEAGDVIAFGDMPNDLAMLSWAGRSVAVANAHPDVRAVADTLARSNDEDGVAAVLERLLDGGS